LDYYGVKRGGAGNANVFALPKSSEYAVHRKEIQLRTAWQPAGKKFADCCHNQLQATTRSNFQTATLLRVSLEFDVLIEFSQVLMRVWIGKLVMGAGLC